MINRLNVNTGKGFIDLGEYYKDSKINDDEIEERSDVIFPNLSNIKVKNSIDFLDTKYFTQYIDHLNYKYNNLCIGSYINILDYFIVVDLITLSYNYSKLFINTIYICFQNMSINKIFIPINLVTASGNHSNLIIIDIKEKTIYFFEPHGKRYSGLISKYINIENKIYNIIKEIFPHLQSFTISNVFNTCHLGVQGKQGLAIRNKQTGGFCLGWSLLFINLIILNSDLNINKIKNFLSNISPDKLNTYINKYVVYVTKFSSKYYIKTNIPHNMSMKFNIILDINEINIIKECIKNDIQLNYSNISNISNINMDIFNLFHMFSFYNELYFKCIYELNNNLYIEK